MNFSSLIAQVAAPLAPAKAEAAAVLLDFQHFAILLLVVGLLIAGLRGRWKDRPERPGVPSRAFNVVDLLVVVTVLGFYYATIFLLTRVQMNPPEEAIETANKIGASAQFLYALLVNGFYVGLIFTMVKFGGLERDPVQMFGFRRLKLLHVLIWSFVGAVIATPAVLSLVPLMQDWLTPLLGPLGEQTPVTNFRETAGFNRDTILLVIAAVVIAPLAEEVIFRGYFYGILKRFTDPMFACLTAGAFFAVVHVNLPALLPLWFFAIFLTLIYEATRCLWVPIGVHALFNATNLVMLFQAINREETTTLGSWFFWGL